MTERTRNRPQATSLRAAMELCLENARTTRQLSVDRVADRLGLSSRWSLYKWVSSGRMPAILIRAFEEACGATHLTEFLASSAGKLLIDVPPGCRVSELQIAQLQVDFCDMIAELLEFYMDDRNPDEALRSIDSVISELAWHRENVRKYATPELDLAGGDG